MNLGNDFKKVMSQRSDTELIEIITKFKNDYQTDAVIAAEEELSKRKLSNEKIKQVENELEQKQAKLEYQANLSLETHWKVLTFIFPGIMNLFLSFIFKTEGHEKKFKQTWRWTLYGIIFYICLVILLKIIFNNQ